MNNAYRHPDIILADMKRGNETPVCKDTLTQLNAELNVALAHKAELNMRRAEITSCVNLLIAIITCIISFITLSISLFR